MPGGVFQMHWQSRNEMHFLYISKGVMRMTGLAMADFTDVPPRALSAVCPDDLPDLLERVYAVALNPDEVIDHRFRIYDPQGGDWLWLEVKARCRPAEGGGMLFNGSFTDVTENQRLKNAVAESERLLKAAFSGSTDGVWEWCCDSDRLYYSPRLFEMLGYADQAMPYHIDTFLKLCHPDDAGVTQAMLRAATQSKRDGPFHAEYRMRAADGSWRWIMGRGAVTQRDPNGRVLRFTGTNTDIQAQKELEARLSEARATAQQASQAKGEFLANMSHEIRTPMNAVVGLTALLSGTPLNARQQSYLQKLRGASESLMSLINNVLDLSKIEAGKLQIENMPFELGEVMERQQALLTEQAATKGLLLSFPTSLPETGQLLGDPVRLGQILLNLVGNAIKFTERGHVTVQVTQLACTVDRVTLRFTVIDTGIGIPPEVAKNLFNPFTQAAPSTTRRFGGTGLGLSICQQLVALMNGEMGLESTPTQGSRFWFTADFGLASTSESPAVKLRSHDSNEVLEGLRVLVAEDNDINMEIITELLQQVGVRVQGAGNGRDAVDACMANRPDVVLMDMQMPEMDGLSATTALRKHPGLADLPIIALTANAMTEDRERCLAAGMNDYLSKPIDLDELYALLRRWRPREEPLP
jgi:PAS domain S-box-containing protein